MSSRSGVSSSPSMSMGSTRRIAFALSTPMSMERNKAEKAPGRIQLLKEDERADQHQKAVCQLHGAAEVKTMAAAQTATPVSLLTTNCASI